MKRTIALVMSLLMLLVLVPTTALADTDMHSRLEVTPLVVTPGTPPKTLFWYGTDSFNWTSANLQVKLFDDTTDKVAGKILPTMGKVIVEGSTYVLYLNGEIYDPATPYNFVPTDLGSKTLTVKYTYKPTGNTNSVTITKDVTISVQKNILDSITATSPTQTEYYAGEFINLAGVTVQAKYTNTTTDPVTLASDGYTVTSDNAAGTNPQPVSAALVAGQTKLKFSRTEKYAGSETEVTKTVTKDIVVKPAATGLTLSESTLNLLITDAPVTVTATTDVNASLVANSSNPAVASINTENLTGAGTFVITPLSVGTTVVTVRTRGTDYSDPLNPKNYSKTISVNVTKAPTLVGGILLDKATITLPLNSPYALTATISPDDTTDKTIVWTSSSPSNVSVDSTGSVKVLRDYSAEAAGSGITVSGTTRYVTITATATNGDTIIANDVTATCLVAVNTIPVDGIAISDTSLTLNKGSWKQLSAVITPTNAANPAVTWSSSDDTIATVDSTGKVTAKGIPTGKDYGEAIITAQTSNAGVYATCSIKVVSAILITGLTLNKSELALNVGEEETLTVTGAPSNATNKNLVWTSSNTDVASVTSVGSSAGKVIAAAKGSAVIRAEATDGSGKYVSCVVTVNNIQVLNVSLDKSSLDMSEGDTAKITATVYPSNATTATLKWTSSNSSVATVDSKGNVIAGATKGYAIITVSATDGSGKFAECVVLSKPKVHVTGLTINYGTTLDLLANDSTYLKATVLPANATVSTVTWASSAPAVASVDASTGLLKGLTLGEATVTATAEGKTVTIKVNVTNTEYNYGVATGFKRRVNVRSKASGLSKAVGFAYNGDTFKILGKSGSWYLIQYNNTTKAYIWASYLKASKTSASYTSANGTTTPAPGATATPVTTTPTKVTIANCQYAVNIRASASTSSKRIGKGSLGATFTYLGKEGDWYKIQYNTTTIGYVFATFATLS